MHALQEETELDRGHLRGGRVNSEERRRVPVGDPNAVRIDGDAVVEVRRPSRLDRRPGPVRRRGSIRCTDPVAPSSQTTFPSVARDWGVTTATLAIGVIGVAGNGDGDGVAGNSGVGLAVGDGVGLELGLGLGLGGGATPKPPPRAPKPRTPTRSVAVAASESRVKRRGRPDRLEIRCHG